MNEPVADPPIPPDGSCVVCGKQRGRDGLRALYVVALQDDPFCSTECARRWYGVGLPKPQVRGRTSYVSSLPPAY